MSLPGSVLQAFLDLHREAVVTGQPPQLEVLTAEEHHEHGEICTSIHNSTDNVRGRAAAKKRKWRASQKRKRDDAERQELHVWVRR